MSLKLLPYEFGLHRQSGKMRFRPGGDKSKEVLVDRIAGQWMTLGTQRSGNINAECALDVRDGTAYVYHPDAPKANSVPGDVVDSNERHDNHDDCQIATENPFPQGRESHWRLCYARERAVASETEPCWRLRDERSNELWFVKDYKGPMNVNWFDAGTHIFHDGSVTVDEEGVAHFGR